MTPELRQLLDRFPTSGAEIIARACSDDARLATFPCTHRFDPALSSDDQAALDALPPSIRGDLEKLYGHYATAELFCVDDESGLELDRPSVWHLLADDAREWWDAADDMDPEQAAMLGSAVVFGRIPSAATYFCLLREGELSGEVAMFVGPGLELAPLTGSFGEFLSRLASKGIDWIAGDVRYLGDDDADQYFPIEYRAPGAPVIARRTVRVRLESQGSRDVRRYEYSESLDDEVEVVAPSGNRYGLVVELHDKDEVHISIGDDNVLYSYVRGCGEVQVSARLADGDEFGAAVVILPG